MKEIRNNIKNNIVLFDSEEPSQDHFEKFNSKLDRFYSERRKNNIKVMVITAVSAAAIFIFIFFISKNLVTQETEFYSNLPDEVKELGLFYENRIEANYRKLNSVDCESQKKEIQMCMKDFRRSLSEIQKDIEENPDDEHLMNALVNHYRIKLEVTEKLINRAKEYCF